MILASIFIGPPGRGEELVLPPLIAENIGSLKQQHPGLPHRLFSGDDIASFLEEKFPREVLDAYNALKPYSYKADLARYCILYELGGIYADLSYFFLRPLPLEEERMIVFRDLPYSAPWDTNTSVIAAPPRHKGLESAVEMVCANVKRGYYGSTCLCPTGPALFGKALATACEAEDLVTGMSLAFTRERVEALHPGVALPESPRVHCLMLGETAVAIKRKQVRAAGLGGLGADVNDDYVAHWNRREIYGSGSS